MMARAGVLLLALLLAGCSDQELYSGLGEREANEMVAVLGNAGVEASKGSDGGAFTVAVHSSQFADAVHVLEQHGLPRVHYETIGDVFAKEGFVSSPLEERARLNFALSQEIAHTISSIDGVVMARVHLAVPQRDEFREETEPASASVFVKHRDTVDLSGSVAQIKALVVNGIENLPYENVTVALFATHLDTSSERVPVNDAVTDAASSASLLPGNVGDLFTSGMGTPLGRSLVGIGLALLGLWCVWIGWLRDRRRS